MVLYFQDFAAGPNATLIPVAGIAGKLWTFSQFETVFLTDDFITEMPDPDSPMVGRGQGMYVTSALDRSSTHTMFSIVFTNEAYNGSTTEIRGHRKAFEAVGNTRIAFSQLLNSAALVSRVLVALLTQPRAS
ncbi:dirigent protein 2-like [Eucalyptus grandis]|uniref:dirigent protein 2-like n=1 Tax=Eucalyptus grandis TaxID=71139 RepID=UPI00192ED4FE|nr:dirigent protein 2-like [Eucalyptus grandis]